MKIKTLTSTLTATALLALAGPAVQTAGAMYPGDDGGSAGVVVKPHRAVQARATAKKHTVVRTIWAQHKPLP